MFFFGFRLSEHSCITSQIDFIYLRNFIGQIDLDNKFLVLITSERVYPLRLPPVYLKQQLKKMLTRFSIELDKHPEDMMNPIRKKVKFEKMTWKSTCSFAVVASKSNMCDCLFARPKDYWLVLDGQPSVLPMDRCMYTFAACTNLEESRKVKWKWKQKIIIKSAKTQQHSTTVRRAHTNVCWRICHTFSSYSPIIAHRQMFKDEREESKSSGNEKN